MSQFLSNLAFLKHFSFTEKAPVRLLILFLLACVFTISDTYAQVLQTYNTAGATTWVCPGGVTSVFIECWGGGGGGGSSNGTTTNGGTGGGGGAYSASRLAVSPGTTYYITVGNGGAATSTTTLAGIGADSWFNTANSAPVSVAGVLAKGGGRGVNNSTTAPGNRGLASGGFGNIKRNGGNGSVGTTTRGGGGGSSAGYLLDGVTGFGVTGATAPAGGGNGGNSTTASPSGSGAQPGGGGGGSDDVIGFVSGAGGIGRVVISVSNDACANATNLPCATSNLAGTTVATVSEISPNSACTGSYGVWYKFTGDGQSTTISSVATFDHGMAIFSASGACSGLTAVECVDNTSGSTETATAFTAVNGTQYYVYIAHYNSTTTGTFTISRTCVAPPADPCASITAISACGSGNAQTYTGGGAGSWNTSTNNSCGWTTPGIEKIYSFVPATTGTYSIQVTAASGYVDYQWKASTCSSTGWTCIDDINTTGAYGSMSWTAGTTYYILLDDEDATTGTHTFYINCPATPPANDACANAIALPCATSNLAGTTVAAVLETSPNSVCTGGYGVWYKFTGDGNSTTISSVATFDHGMAIFSASGACSGLTTVECVDNTFGSTETSAAFTAVSGTQYYVYIAHFNSTTTGTFTISRTCVAPPADPCASVTAMTCGTTYNTSMSGSSSAWNLSSCYILGTPGQERVFSFTPATTGNYRLDVPALTGGYIDFFYRSGSCSGPSGWTCLGDLNGPGYANLDLIGGTTYHFLLDPEGTGSYTASLNFICAPSNDACANATTLTLDAAPVTGNIASANLGSGACSGYDDYDVWYKFTTQCTGNYVVTVDPGFDFDAVFQVYEGSCSGTQVVPTAGSDLGDACIDGPGDNGNEFGTFNLQAGTTYFVRVYDFQDLFDFDIPGGSSFVIDVNNNASAINSGFATWTGNATDRLWQNSVNWDCGVVPTATTRVIIPAQVAVNRKPQINNGISADVLDIEIQGSTVDLLEVLNGGDLEVHTP